MKHPPTSTAARCTPNGSVRTRITTPTTTMRALVTVRYPSAHVKRGVSGTGLLLRELAVALRQRDFVLLEQIVLPGIPEHRPLMFFPVVRDAAGERQALPPPVPEIVAEASEHPRRPRDAADRVGQHDLREREQHPDQPEEADDRHHDGRAAAPPGEIHRHAVRPRRIGIAKP